MLCDKCKKRNAVAHFKENINGVKKELHLCSQCAAEMSYNNIFSEIELSICDALCGTEVTVECIDETKVKFKTPKITKEGHLFKFSGKGLKDPQNNNKRGDHIVVVKYKYPTEISKEQEKLLKEFDKLEKK